MIVRVGQRAARVAAGLYVALAASLTITHGVTGDPGWVLAAVVATVPLGVVAFVAIYVSYAVIQGVGGLFADTRLPDGSETPWLHHVTVVLIVALFVAAAIGNVLLLRHRMRTSGGATRSD